MTEYRDLFRIVAPDCQKTSQYRSPPGPEVTRLESVGEFEVTRWSQSFSVACRAVEFAIDWLRNSSDFELFDRVSCAFIVFTKFLAC